MGAEPTTPDVRVVRLVTPLPVEIDRRLPPWARRSNPIIRRHLGLYWKTILPDGAPLVKIVLAQVVYLGLTYFIPWLFDLALPTITAAIMLLPLALAMYMQCLFAIGAASALAMADELRGDTLNLLRVTPFNLPSILASKIAAAIWRQVEDLGLLLMAAALLSLPLLVSTYAAVFPIIEQPVLSRVAMILGLVVSLLRLALEPAMIGALGALIGTALPYRAWAVASTTALWGFYFLLINLLRFIPLSPPLRLIADFVLPVLLPLGIAYVAFRLTLHLLTRG